MKRLAVLAFVVAAMTVWGPAQAAQENALVGQPAPEIAAQYWLNSPPLTLKALRGKVVVVEFWATWCPPCRTSIPHLIELSQKYGPQGVVFISLTDEAKEKVEPFAKELGMTYAVGGGSRAGGEYGATSIPTAFVVDTTGKVAWAGHPMDEKFVSAIDAELKKAPPKAAVESKGPASLDEVAALLQKAQYGRAAAMLAKFQVPEGDTTAKSRVDRMRKTLVAQAPTRLAQGEKSLAAKEYYKASEAFKDVLAMAPDSPQANRAQEHLKGLEADENLKAEIDQGRQKAADDLLAEILKHEKANPAATLKALEDLIDRFPDTKAATLAAKKVKWLSAKGSGAKTE